MRLLIRNRTSKPEQAPYRKLLLLGTGDGGKSTFVKQCRNLYQLYSTNELRAAREQVVSNLLEFIGQLITACEESEFTITHEDAADYIEKLLHDSQMMVSVSSNMSEEIVQHIRNLWSEKSFQIVYEARKEFQINENGKYWIDNLDRITKQDYQPTMEDFMRTKMKTVGVIETEKIIELSENLINKDNNPISLVDVGGQRAERKKWTRCYENTTAVLFFVSLSEYDQNLYEDDITNRMSESLKVWSKVINDEEQLQNIKHFYLIFTKLDLLKKQLNGHTIETKPLEKFDPNIILDEQNWVNAHQFEKSSNLEERTAQCIVQKFVKQVKDAKRREAIAKRVFLANCLENQAIKGIMTEILSDIIIGQ